MSYEESLERAKAFLSQQSLVSSSEALVENLANLIRDTYEEGYNQSSLDEQGIPPAPKS